MKRIRVMGMLLLGVTCGMGVASAGALPNAATTPGVADTAMNVEVLCSKHWSTKSVRPPANYTNKLKKKQIQEYKYADKNPKHYEEDHLIPLELGGNPKDEGNLWPQARTGQWNAAQKDKLENKLHKLVCASKVDLEEAQKAIAVDWVGAYTKYMGMSVK
jgi:hypothetical protein